MHTLFNNLLDLLFPPRCAACRSRGALFCARCCARCRFVPAAANTEQHRRLNSPVLASTAGAYIFEGALREALHAFKYHRRARLATPLGGLLAGYLAQHPCAVDALVPVPLHPSRIQQRGFNQSLLLAQALAKHLHIPVLTTEVVRVRHTQQQADLSRAQRRENVRNAFAWQGRQTAPRRILIVDDVLTTGATVEAVAQVLWNAGSREIHALALARGL